MTSCRLTNRRIPSPDEHEQQQPQLAAEREDRNHARDGAGFRHGREQPGGRTRPQPPQDGGAQHEATRKFAEHRRKPESDREQSTEMGSGQQRRDCSEDVENVQ